MNAIMERAITAQRNDVERCFREDSVDDAEPPRLRKNAFIA